MGGIINPAPSEVTPKTPATGRAVAPSYNTPLVETRNQPLSSLLTRMEGSNFIITLYSAVLDTDSQLIGPQQTRSGVYQQYDKTSRLETKLQGDLSFSQDEKSKDRSITGELMMYPYPVPNVGDVFRADAGDGRQALFKFNTAVVNTWMKLACHRVSFQMIDIEGSPTWKDEIRSLEQKVQNRYTFVKDYMLNNKIPIVVDEDYQGYRDLKRLYSSMAMGYWRNFYDSTTHTLVVPHPNALVYDPFLMRAVLALSDPESSEYVRTATDINVDTDPAFSTPTVWDSLLYVNESHLHVACHRMSIRDKSVVIGRMAMGGLWASRIDKVVYPTDHRTDGSRVTRPSVYGSGENMVRSPAPIDDFQRLVNTKDTTDVQIVDEVPPGPFVRPNIHRVSNDEYYVFSKAFYKRDEALMSTLELMVWTVFDQEDVDIRKLVAMVNESQIWDDLERFYLIPVLMVLCTIVMRGPSIYGE